jgi:hypothetical protein
MLILPMDKGSLVESRSMTLSDEVAKNVVNDLLPQSKRGKFLMGTFVNGFCFPENDRVGTEEDYENVNIYYNAARESGQVCYVHVRFKKQVRLSGLPTVRPSCRTSMRQTI